MQIGVICEGPTDFIAIEAFLGAALKKRRIDSEFIAIQPDPDNTSGTGWTRVFSWLESNPPETRLPMFLKGGLFAGAVSANQCDVLVIQMDSDILDQSSFVAHINNKGLTVKAATSAIHRGKEIDRLLGKIGRISELSEDDAARHVLAPTVESSETWCVAAFPSKVGNLELLKEQDLWNAFGEMSARSRRDVPNPPYGKPSKNINRRKAFCDRHRNSRHIESQAHHFKQLVDRTFNAQNLLGL